MVRLIYFLVRLKLGVRKYQFFRFSNQKDDSLYYITEYGVIKLPSHKYERLSKVGINFLLSDRCKVEIIGGGA